MGWPPIRSYRKNRLSLQKGITSEDEIFSDEQKNIGNAATAAAVRFVKVSLDGAPYLRKVDFSTYSSYKQLSDALAKLFGPFTIGKFCSFLKTLSYHKMQMMISSLLMYLIRKLWIPSSWDERFHEGKQANRSFKWL